MFANRAGRGRAGVGTVASPPTSRWRVLVNNLVAPEDVLVELAEVKFFDVQGGADITTGGTASASSEKVGFEAAKAFDKVLANTWQADWPGPHWIAYQFASPVAPKYVTLTGSAVDENRDPYSLTIQRSSDGVAWVNVVSYSGLAWPAPNFVIGFAIP